MKKDVLTTKFLLLLLLVPLILIFSILLLTKRTYEVTFFDSDGTVLSTQKVEENQFPSFSEIPKRASDSQYDYVFKSWDRPLELVTGNTAYTANYELVPKKKEENSNEITYVAPTIDDVEGDEVLYNPADTREYTVQFIDDDGTFLQTLSVRSGEIPMYTKLAPVPKVKGEYLYIFKGWDKDYTPVTDSQVYKAVYNKIKLTNSKASSIKTEDTNTYYYSVKATVSPNTNYGTVQGGGTYAENTVVLLEAKPKSGYEFLGWNDGDKNTTKKITVTTDVSLVARFGHVADTRNKFTISTSSSDYAHGRVTGGATYYEGDTVTLTAIPNRGYKFVKWNDGNTNITRKFVVNSSTSSDSYEATFEPAQSYTISVVPNSPSCGFCTGSGSFYEGDTITITASPNTNYRFSHWEDEPENTGRKRTITVTENKTYKAVFVYNGFPEKNDTITLLDETTGHRNYLVLSADIDTGYVTLLSRDSLLKTQVSGKNGYGDVYKTYKDSNLDKLCTQFYNDLSAKTQRAIIDTDVKSYMYLGDINTVINNRSNQFYYPGIIKEEKDSTDKIVSTYTRKVLVPDLSDIEKYFGASEKQASSYTLNDLKKFFNVDDPSAYHEFAVRSLVGTLENNKVNVVDKGIIYFSETEGFVSTTSDIGGNTKTVRPMFTINLFDENLNYINDNKTIEYDKAIPVTHNVKILSSDNGSVENALNGNINHGTLLMPEAKPDDTYLFYEWDDGNKDTIRYIPVVDDVDLLATFTKKMYTIIAKPTESCVKFGSVELSSDRAVEGGQVTITAKPKAGYRFVEWDDGNTDAVRVISNINDSTPLTYLATFSLMKLPKKGTVININGETDKHKEYLVVGTDSTNNTITLISRDSDLKTKSEASSCGNFQYTYKDSKIDKLCEDFYNQLLPSTQNAIVESTIEMNSYYYSDAVFDVNSHNNNFTFPGKTVGEINETSLAKVESSKAKVFVPDLKDIEGFFGANNANAGVYSGTDLFNFFNSAVDTRYVVRSLSSAAISNLNPDRAKLIYFGSTSKKFFTINNSDAYDYVVRPMFVVKIKSDGFSFNETSTKISSSAPSIKKNVNISATTGGKVSVSSGAHTLGTLLYVTASSTDTLYRFDNWSDDATNTNPSRYIVVDNDKTIKAQFVRDYNVTVSVASECSNMGDVSVSNNGVVKTGATIKITAAPKPGYRFVKWDDGNTSQERDITGFNDSTPLHYVATFEALKVPAKGDIISIDGESDNHKEYLVLDIDVNNNNMLVISRDSLSVTENIISSCGDYQYTYKDSKLDVLCTQFFDDLKQTTKDAIVETTLDLNKYYFENNLNLVNTYSSNFAYPGVKVDEIDKSSSNTVASSKAKVFVPDLKDIEVFFGASSISAGTFSDSDLKKFFNTSDGDTRKFVLRSLYTSNNKDLTIDRGQYVIYDSSNSVISSASSNVSAQYNIRPMMNIKVNSQNFTYNVIGSISSSSTPKMINVKFLAKGDGSITGNNGLYNYGTLIHGSVNSGSETNFIKWHDNSTDQSKYFVVKDSNELIKALFKDNNLNKAEKGDFIYFADEKENHKKFVVLSIEVENEKELARLLCIDTNVEMQMNFHDYFGKNVDQYMDTYHNDFSDEFKDAIVTSTAALNTYAIDGDTFAYPLDKTSTESSNINKLCYLPDLRQLNELGDLRSSSFKKLFGDNTVITSSKYLTTSFFFFSNGRFVYLPYDTKAKICPTFVVDLGKLNYYEKVGKFKNDVKSGDFITINGLNNNYNDYIVLKADDEKATVMLIDKLTSKSVGTGSVAQFVSDECDDFYSKLGPFKDEVLDSTKVVYQYVKESAEGKDDFDANNVFNVQNNIESTINSTSNGPIHSVGLLDLEELFGGDLSNSAEIRKSYLNALFNLGDNELVITRDYEKVDNSPKNIVINKNGYNTYSNTSVRICPVFDINLLSTNYTITKTGNILSNIKTVTCSSVYDEDGLMCSKSFHFYKDEAISIPEQTRPGYSFDSWEPALPTNITDDLSPNAKWTRNNNKGIINYFGLFNNKTKEYDVNSVIKPILVDPIEVNKDKENKSVVTYKASENEEYKIINNIKSTQNGHQYIDLNVLSSDVKSIDIQFSMNDISGDQILFGTYTTNGPKGSNYVQINKNQIVIYGNKKDNRFTYSPSANKIYRIVTPVTSTGTAYLYDDNNNILDSLDVPTPNKETGKMLLFDLYLDNAVSSTHYTRMSLYSFKAYGLDDELLLDLVPVERSKDNKLGLFDRVSEKFLVNSGTGEDFVKGTELYPSSEFYTAYEKLDFITSDGNQYIDTLVKDYAGLKVNVTGNFDETTGSSLMGVKETDSGVNKQFYFGINNNKFVSGLGQSNIESSVTASTDFFIFSINSGTNQFYVNGFTSSFDALDNNDLPSLNFTLFGLNEGAAGVQCCKAAISKVEFIHVEGSSTTGTTFKELIPVKRMSDGAIGMYDTYDKVFYPNKGTGSFTATPKIAPEYIKEHISSTDTFANYYEELEYIESHGKEVINTGITATNPTVDIKFQMYEKTSYSGVTYLFGKDYADNNNYSITFLSKTEVEVGGTNGWETFSVNDISIGVHTLSYKSGELIIDDVLVGQPASSITNTHPICLFGRELQTPSHRSIARIYSCKIYENSADGSSPTLLLDLVPVRRLNDNIVGMYDKLSGKFFGNDGEGYFTGASKASPSFIRKSVHQDNIYNVNVYEKLDYIQSSGTQYIDTNIKTELSSSSKNKIEMDFEITNTSKNQSFFGVLNNSSNKYFRFFEDVSNGNKFGIEYGGSSAVDLTLDSSRNKLVLDFASGSVSLNGSSIGSVSASDSSWNNSIYLFATHDGTGPATGSFANMRLYEFKYYDSNGELIEDLVPVKRLTDNAVGMYDTVSKKFFGNSGNGSFTGQAKTVVEYIQEPVQRVDYLSSSASHTQYIDVGISSITQNLKTVVKAHRFEKNKSIFGYDYGDNKRYNYTGNSNSPYNGDLVRFGSSVLTLGGEYVDNTYIFDVENGIKIYSSDGEQLLNSKLSESTFNYSSTMYLFARKTASGANDNGYQSIYYCKIYDNGKLIRDFIPVKHNDEYCLLDLVDNRLFVNKGSGKFTGGYVNNSSSSNVISVSKSSEYKKLEYIESTGEQYIDLNFVPDNNSRVIIEGSNIVNDTNSWLSSARSAQSSNMFDPFLVTDSSSTNKRFRSSYGNTNQYFSTLSISDVTDNDFIIDMNKNVVLVKFGQKTEQLVFNPATFSSSCNLVVFAGASNNSVTYYSRFKLKSYKLYDNGVLIRDLVPVEDSNGVAGLLDLIDNTFYTNKGTGEFIKGDYEKGNYIPFGKWSPELPTTMSNEEITTYALFSTYLDLDNDGGVGPSRVKVYFKLIKNDDSTYSLEYVGADDLSFVPFKAGYIFRGYVNADSSELSNKYFVNSNGSISSVNYNTLHKSNYSLDNFELPKIKAGWSNESITSTRLLTYITKKKGDGNNIDEESNTTEILIGEPINITVPDITGLDISKTVNINGVDRDRLTYFDNNKKNHGIKINVDNGSKIVLNGSELKDNGSVINLLTRAASGTNEKFGISIDPATGLVEVYRGASSYSSKVPYVMSYFGSDFTIELDNSGLWIKNSSGETFIEGSGNLSTSLDDVLIFGRNEDNEENTNTSFLFKSLQIYNSSNALVSDIVPVSVDDHINLYDSKLNTLKTTQVDSSSNKMKIIGYSFDRWDYMGELVMPNDDITISALYNEVLNEYKSNHHTVTFNTNGGTYIPVLSLVNGATITYPTSNPTKEGFIFGGWDRKPDKMGDSDITVTAIWKKAPNKGSIIKLNDGKEYRVLSIDGNNVKVMTFYEATNIKYYSDEASVKTTTFKNGSESVTGVKYDGSNLDNYLEETWYEGLNTGSTVPMYKAIQQSIVTQNYYQCVGDSHTTASDFDSGNITYKYQYLGQDKYENFTYKGSTDPITRHVYTFDLKDIYDYYGKSILSNYETNSLFPKSFVYRKSSWLISTSFSTWVYNLYVGDNKNIGRIYSMRHPASDDVISVYPVFTIDLSYDGVQFAKANPEIIFDTDGGEYIQPISETAGTNIQSLIPSAPRKPGYTFTGWSETVPNTMPSEDLVVKATWKAIFDKGDFITINGEDSEHNDYMVLKAEGSKIYLLAKDHIHMDYVDKTGGELTAEVINSQLASFKNKLSSNLQNLLLSVNYDSYKYPAVNVAHSVASPLTSIGEKDIESISFYELQEFLNIAAGYSAEMVSSIFNLPTDDNHSLFARDMFGTTNVCLLNTIIGNNPHNTHVCPVFWIDLAKDIGNEFSYKKNGNYFTSTTKRTITFNNDDNTLIETKTFKVGERIVPPVNLSKTGYIHAGWDPDLSDFMPDVNITVNAKWNIMADPGDFITINGEDSKHNDYMVLKVDGTKMYLLAKDHIHMDYIQGDNKFSQLSAEELNNQLDMYKSHLSPNLQNLIINAEYSIHRFNNINSNVNSFVASITGNRYDMHSVSLYELREFLGIQEGISNVQTIFNIPYSETSNYCITTRDTDNIYDVTYRRTTLHSTADNGNSIQELSSGITHICPVFWIDLSKDTENSFSFKKTGNYKDDINTSHKITFKDGDNTLKELTFKVGERITPPTDLINGYYTYGGSDPELPDFMPNGDLTVNVKWKVNADKGDFITINGEDSKHNDYMVLKVDDTKMYLLAKDHIHMDYINKSQTTMIADEINAQLSTYRTGLSDNLKNLISTENYNTYQYEDNAFTASNVTSTPSSKDIDTVSFYELQEFLNRQDPDTKNTDTIFNIPYINDDVYNAYTITTRDKYNGNFIVLYSNQYYDTVGINPYYKTHVCPVFWIDLSKDTGNTFSFEKTGNYKVNETTTHKVTFKNGENTYKELTFNVGQRITTPSNPTKEGFVFDGWIALPEGYRRLEYIESTGTQCINLEYKVGSDTRAEIEGSDLEFKKDTCISLSRKAQNTQMFEPFLITSASVDNQRFRTSYENQAKYFTKFTQQNIVNKDFVINMNKNRVFVKFDSVSEEMVFNYKPFNTENSIYVFASNTNSSIAHKGSFKLKSYKLYDKDVLVRDLIPVEDPSGKIGLYDLVNGKFYVNSSTGTFNKGSYVNDNSDNSNLGVLDFMPDRDLTYTARWRVDAEKGDFITINGEDSKHNDYMVLNIEGTKMYLLAKDHIHMDYIDKKNVAAISDDDINTQLQAFEDELTTDLKKLMVDNRFKIYTYTDGYYKRSASTYDLSDPMKMNSVSSYEIQEFLNSDSLASLNTIFNLPSNQYFVGTRDFSSGNKHLSIQASSPTPGISIANVHACPVFWIDLSKDTDNSFSYQKTGNYFDNKTTTHKVIFKDDNGGTLSDKELKVGLRITPPEDPTKEGFIFDGWNPEPPDFMPNNDLTLTAKFVPLAEKGDFITINGEDSEHNDYMVLKVDDNKMYLLAKDHIHMEYINTNTNNMTDTQISNQLNNYKNGLTDNLMNLISTEDFNTYSFSVNGYPHSTATSTSSLKDIDTVSFYELQEFLEIENHRISNTDTIFNIPYINIQDSNMHTITTRDKFNGNFIVLYSNQYSDDAATNSFYHTHICPVFWIDLSKGNTFTFEKTGNYFTSTTKHTITFNDENNNLIGKKELAVGERITPPTDLINGYYTYVGSDPELPDFMPNEDLTVNVKLKVNADKGDFITINGEDSEHNDYMVLKVDGSKMYLLAKDHVHIEYINNSEMTYAQISNQLNNYKNGLSDNLTNLISTEDFNTYQFSSSYYYHSEVTQSSYSKDIDTVSFYELQEFLNRGDDNISNTDTIFNILYINNVNRYSITTRDAYLSYIIYLYSNQYSNDAGTNSYDHTHICPVFWIDLSKDTGNTFSFEKTGNYFTSTTKHTITFNDENNNLIEKKEFAVGERIIPPTILQKEGFIYDGWYPELPDFMPDKNLTFKVKCIKEIQKGSIIKLNDGKEYRVLSLDGTNAKVTAMYDAKEDRPPNYYSNDFINGDEHFTGGFKYLDSVFDKYLNETWYNSLNASDETKPMYNAIQKVDYYQRAYEIKIDQSSIDFSNGVIYINECEKNKYDYYTYKGLSHVGDRFVYLLDIKDIYDYFNTSILDYNKLKAFFDVKNNRIYIAMSHSAQWNNQHGSYVIDNTFNALGIIIAANSASKIRPTFIIDLSADGVVFSKANPEIIFDTDGGNFIQPISQAKGTDIKSLKPANPTREGFIFDGWDKMIPDTMPESDMVIKAKWRVDGVYKGSIIKLNDGKQYRVLGLDGTKAKVMAMYDGLRSNYSDGATTTFTNESTAATTEGLKYEGSALDDYLNQWYTKLNTGDTIPMYNAIQKTNINQSIYSMTSSKPSASDVYYEVGDSSRGYYIYKGSVSVGERYVYELGLEDVFNYAGSNFMFNKDLGILFYNRVSGSDSVWFNSVSEDPNNPFYYFNAGNKVANGLNINYWEIVRPTFTIDLAADGVVFSKANPEIIFDTDGGSFIQPISQVKGTDIKSLKPADPTKEGAIFDGWDKQIPDTMPESDMVIKAKWIYKGSIIKLNDNKEYRVLGLDGTNAKVMAMYNDLSSKYSVGATTTFTNESTGATTEGLKYEGSTLDNYLSQWYTNLNTGDTIPMYNAIQTTNISQGSYEWTGNTPKSSDVYYEVGVSSWGYYIYKGSVSIGERYVYELGIEDVFNYAGSNYISPEELNKLFDNQVLSTNQIWLNSSEFSDKSYPFIYFKRDSQFTDGTKYNVSLKVRPTFSIDLAADGVVFSKANPEIIFDTDGGNFIQPISQAKGTDIKSLKPANPTKEGFEFNGWDVAIPDTMPESDMVIKAKWYKPIKGDLITISGEKDNYNDYIVLSVDGNKVKLALRDEMPSFTLKNEGIDQEDRNAIMGYIDEKCDEFKNNLSFDLQSSIVETDYYSTYYTTGGAGRLGLYDDTLKMKYSNKYVTTLSFNEVIDLLGDIHDDKIEQKFAPIFFLSDTSYDIIARDFFSSRQSLFQRGSLMRRAWKDGECRLCPVFIIDLSKLTSNIAINGNVLKNN